MFLCLLSHLVLSDSLTSHRLQLPRLLCPAVSAQGKWTVTSLFKLNSVCGFIKTQNVILQVEFCPIWSSKSIPAPKALHGTWRMLLAGWQQIEGLLGDQQCVRPGPPLQPEAAVFISICQCSHINPISFRTGMTQVSFLQTLWQHLYWNTEDIYMELVQTDVEPGEGISTGPQTIYSG